MTKVTMHVQTTFHGKLLREGKQYEVDEATARRWASSRIATIIPEKSGRKQESPDKSY